MNENFDALTVDDKIVSKYARLSASAKARRKAGVIILDGIHLVREAMSTFGATNARAIFVTDRGNDQSEIQEILSEVQPGRITLISEDAMKILAATVTPQGILAVYNAPEESEYSGEKAVLILEDLQDPSNVGAVIRTAAALGFDAVALTKKSTDPWSPRALRASQGAHFYTKIITDLDIAAFKEHFGGTIIGSILDSEAQSLYKTKLSGSVAIVVGNEGAGITDETIALCDQKIYIPMNSNFESLNVAHAAAIMCAEKARQDGL